MTDSVIFRPLDEEEAYDRMERIYALNPGYSNYFNQPLETTDYFCGTSHSFVLAKPLEGGYYRIYLISDDLEDICGILKALKGQFVVNFPTDGDVSSWQKLMDCSGFQLTGVYERFYNIRIRQLGNPDNIRYAVPDEEEAIYRLYHEYFSPYTDYPPDREELRRLIQQKKVLVNYNDSSLCGAFIFSVEGKKCYLRLWRDIGANSLKLLWDVYTLMYQQHIGYVYFWVNSENEKVKSIHRMLGAQMESLKDYSFIKQNTEL